MTELVVQIVKLEPMRMISAYGFGAEPELIAWEKINHFALYYFAAHHASPLSLIAVPLLP